MSFVAVVLTSVAGSSISRRIQIRQICLVAFSLQPIQAMRSLDVQESGSVVGQPSDGRHNSDAANIGHRQDSSLTQHCSQNVDKASLISELINEPGFPILSAPPHSQEHLNGL